MVEKKMNVYLQYGAGEVVQVWRDNPGESRKLVNDIGGVAYTVYPRTGADSFFVHLDPRYDKDEVILEALDSEPVPET